MQLTQALPSVVFQLRFARAHRPRFELVFANRRADELLRPIGPIATDTFTAFARALDPTQRRRLTKMFLRSARGLASVRDEFMVEQPEGREAWFHIEAAPKAREDGSVVIPACWCKARLSRGGKSATFQMNWTRFSSSARSCVLV